MAVDVPDNFQDSEEDQNLKVWKEFYGLKCRKWYTEMKPWLIDIGKVLATVLIGAFVALFVYSERAGEVKDHRDLSSSIVSMEPLLEIEQKLVQALDDYANELQRKVNTIRCGLAKMRKATEIHDINAEEFLGNPLNSFPMLRRFKNEWKAWELYLQKAIGKDQIQTINKVLNDMIEYDIFESIERIEILRKIYDIQPDDWIKGKLNRKIYDLNFSALDAYSVAFLLFKKKNYVAADEWYMAALKAYENWDMYDFLNFNRSFIYESYISNLIKQNRTELALTVTGAALENDMENAKLLQKKEIIQTPNLTPSETSDFQEESYLENSIERGCRGDYVLNTSLQLYCYYNTSINDFVRLAPFKVEELFLDPVLLLYHDIVNDEEIFELKNISRRRLKSSVAFQHNSESNLSYRTSDNAWLCGDENEHVSQLDRRIEDMTGLEIGDAPLLVGNYGLGGFSKEHEDCLIQCFDKKRKPNFDAHYGGVLIFLTDVENGGLTIFPRLEVSNVPQKGTALVWYNFKNDMEQCDGRTLHMECPVVVGSKWFAVKWINSKKQMFTRPCYRNTDTNVTEVLIK